MIKKAFLCFIMTSIPQMHAAQEPAHCPAALYLALLRPASQDFAKILNARPELANAVDFSCAKTILMHAAFIGKPDHMRLLLERGAEVNAQNADGETALIHAFENGRLLEPIKLLVEAGAALNCVSKKGRTVLSIACSNYRMIPANHGYREIVDYVHLQLSTQIGLHQSHLTAVGLPQDIIREIVPFIFHAQDLCVLEQNTNTALTVSRQLAGIKKKRIGGKRKKIDVEQDAIQFAAKKKK